MKDSSGRGGMELSGRDQVIADALLAPAQIQLGSHIRFPHEGCGMIDPASTG